MIAFLIAELGEWRGRSMRKTLCLSTLLLALVGLVGPLQPLLLALACALVFVAAAWGRGQGPGKGAEVDPQTFPAKALDIAAGKALAALVLWLGICFALSPILTASAIAWGLSGWTILACLLSWLSAYLLASSIDFLSKLVFEKTESFVGLGINVAWLFLSFFNDSLKPMNPFVQAWSIMRLEAGRAVYAGICAELGAAAVVFACSALVLGSKKRSRNA